MNESPPNHRPPCAAPIIARVHHRLQELDAPQWDALLATQARPTPFMRHAYLQAMEQSGSASSDTGWLPRHVALWQGERLLAACPLYLKSHSWGEYVFDFAWARAYQQHGLRYYPKAVIGVPFTPVPGSRLLAPDAVLRRQLLQAVLDWCQSENLGSLHLLFPGEQDLVAGDALGLLLREGVQFHWTNPATAPFHDFEDFLARLQRDKRRKIRQEMRKVRDAGVSYRHLLAPDIAEADWAFFRSCYQRTYLEHGNAPYLNDAFWQHMQTDLPGQWLLIIAERAGHPVASSLIGLHDNTRHGGPERIAYGRYWGALERIDCLHFDLCYYQPLAWCIANGYQRFEGGAQGEHKLARALLPQTTHSAHWIADARFRAAIADFLQQEREHVGHYHDMLDAHSPLRPRD
ncbi:N-acetyltransferase [Corticibacter populi]|uniref:N-acetyltransferase n=1 Tax=Corticibacter populi TaxID=1550736 RepID=A0A3M6R0E5_9BURK|nr:GNAT family N-acetyltransferase [Corticibacter populi]RMX08675.1 N-acetyltransferase [Corticibacter populi]RZS36015.1 hypothetical protein EV687_1101 [Corticibacter populi]